MLTADPVSALALESSTLRLWEEFLRGYFDGASHAVGHNAGTVAFPAAALRFQQSAVPQPLDGRSISVVWVGLGTKNRCKEEVSGQWQDMIYAKCSWQFWVRAQFTSTGAGNAAEGAMTTAELLHGLLENAAATLPLNQKGILHLRPQAPQLISNGPLAGGHARAGDGVGDYAFRLVVCRGTARYPVLSQA